MTATPPSRPASVLRPLTPADEPLVLRSWLSGAREVEPYAHVPAGRYYAAMRPFVAGCLGRCGAIVVAHEEDPAEVIGWACVEPGGAGAAPPVVHWIYVYSMWRRLGFARTLLEAAGVAVEGPRPSVTTTGWSRHVRWIGRRVRLAYEPWSGRGGV